MTTDRANAEFSRRDFLIRAGSVGALSVVGSRFANVLNAEPGSPASPDLGVFANNRVHAAAQQLASGYSGLHWRLLGPFRGGRVDAVSGVPGRPNEFYFGHVNGGVWKSIDAGRVWTPVFDSQPVASIGAIAVGAVRARHGVRRQRRVDAARFDGLRQRRLQVDRRRAGRWTHLGLDETQHIGKIAVDPQNPNIVFVAAIGHLYAPNPDRGVFRSRDGGKTLDRRCCSRTTTSAPSTS